MIKQLQTDGIKMFKVYKHTSPNGKVYIGITSMQLERRWHFGKAYKKNKDFYSDILEYGWENFIHEILYNNLTKEEACSKEIELISFYKSNLKEYGYNHSTGGQCTSKGCVWSNDHREKIKRSLKGHYVSLETRNKISTASKNQKNRVNPPIHVGADNYKSKGVSIFDKNGNIIKSFDTLKDASNYLNVCHQSVSDCCRGRIKTVKGFVLKYNEV